MAKGQTRNIGGSINTDEFQSLGHNLSDSEKRKLRVLKSAGGGTSGFVDSGVTFQRSETDKGRYIKKSGKIQKGFKSKKEWQADWKENRPSGSFDYAYGGEQDTMDNTFDPASAAAAQDSSYTPGQSSTAQGYRSEDSPINQQGSVTSRANLTGAASTGKTGVSSDSPMNQQISTASTAATDEEDDSGSINRY